MTTEHRWLTWQTEPGQAIQIGEQIVTPYAQSLVIRWPNGGLVWSRPVALMVERPGSSERIPIRDLTRLLQIVLLAFGFAWMVIAYSAPSGKQEQKK